MKEIFSIGVLLLTLAACAPGPNAVAPVAMPSNAYTSLSCASARQERAKVANEVAALSTKQSNAAVGDAIGVFLIAVPVSSLTGNDVRGDLGAAKGKMLALDARLTNC